MSKARQPVSVAGIEFDALISESRTYEASVPEYAVESGVMVSDDIILGSEKLDMTLYLTDTPVTWRGHAGRGRVEAVVQQLEELYYTKSPVTVVTSEKTFTSMAIISITISKSFETGYAREIPISFQKIRVTTAKTTSIPASYGRSGNTQAAAGTANTSSSGNTAGNGGSGSSGEKGSKSSILYSAAKGIGLIQ
jgi:hypothetical protein